MRAKSSLQKQKPQMVTLVKASAAGEQTATIRFRVPTPDSRLRVKISILFIPNAGTQSISPDITGGNTTLWLCATDDDQSGTAGSTIPMTNIEGTQATPTAIPATSGLLGYSRAFVTSADYIEGTLFTETNGLDGYWVLQTRYQPDAVRFTEDEWDDITVACNPRALDPVASI